MDNRNRKIPMNKSMIPLNQRPNPFKEKILAMIAVALTFGVVLLAVTDTEYRSHFFVFANTFIAGYAGIELTKRQ